MITHTKTGENVITGRYLYSIGKTERLLKNNFFMVVEGYILLETFLWNRIISAATARAAS
jgi:hypothetical protein